MSDTRKQRLIFGNLQFKLISTRGYYKELLVVRAHARSTNQQGAHRRALSSIFPRFREVSGFRAILAC